MALPGRSKTRRQALAQTETGLQDKGKKKASSRARLLGGGEVVGDDGGAGFDEGLFGRGEGGGEIAFDVEFGGEFVVGVDGHDDFRFDGGGAGEIARVAGDVLNDDDLAGAGGGAAKSSAERDAHVGREAAGEGADDQEAGVDGVDEVEAHPVVAGHFFVEAVCEAFHQGRGGGGGARQVLQFAEEVLVRWGHEEERPRGAEFAYGGKETSAMLRWPVAA